MTITDQVVRGPVKKDRPAPVVRTVTRRNAAGHDLGKVDLEPSIFGHEPNVAVMHQVVTAQLAADRGDHGRGHPGQRPGREATLKTPGGRRALPEAQAVVADSLATLVSLARPAPAEAISCFANSRSIARPRKCETRSAA